MVRLFAPTKLVGILGRLGIFVQIHVMSTLCHHLRPAVICLQMDVLMITSIIRTGCY